jgi:hypothetical protein
MSVVAGFPSALAITSFIVNLLKTSPPSKLVAQDLLLVVENIRGRLDPFAVSYKIFVTTPL